MQRLVLAVLLINISLAAAEESITELAKIIADNNAEMGVRVAAAKKLGDKGKDARLAVDALASAYNDFLIFQVKNKDIIEGKRQPTPEEEERLLKTIDGIGKLYHATANALGKIGPDAASAIPTLMKDLKQNCAGIAGTTILKIDPSRQIEVNEILIVGEVKRWIFLQEQLFKTARQYATTYKDLENAGRIPPSADDNTVPDWGYRFKSLAAQTERGNGGRQSFLVEGKMTKGFGFIVYPAEYGITAKTSFLVIKLNGQPVRTYSRDLGTDTSGIVAKMSECDPDDKWVQNK